MSDENESVRLSRDDLRAELAALVEIARTSGNPEDLESIIELVAAAAEAGDIESVAAALAALRPADRADVFETLDLDEQSAVITELRDEDAADILESLEDEDAAEIAEALEPEELATILDQMEPDEAADVLGDLSPAQAESAMRAMDDAAEAEVRTLLAYPDESAGGRMTSEFIALRSGETVAQSIDRLRQLSPDQEVTYYLYITDADEHLTGIVSLRQLITADPLRPVGALADPNVIYVDAEDDQESAARVMSRYDLMALPVVDRDKRLVGVIAHDDLVQVLEEEATEDMYRLVGLDEEERPSDTVARSVRRRLPWIVTNLGTQLLLIAVLVIFKPLLDSVATLATLFPLVTGNGGNVGAQATTIMVRAMALGDVGRNHWRILMKEVLVGLILGLTVGTLAAVVALLVGTSDVTVRQIALAVFLAMAMNLAAGGFAGVLIPLSLKRFGVDPAVASVVFVTTVTDTLGAFLFLGVYSLLVYGR